MLQINKYVDYFNMLAIYNIETIKYRMAFLKLIFLYKLKNKNDPRSISNIIYKEIINNPKINVKQLYKEPIIINIKRILEEVGLIAIAEGNNEFTDHQMKKIMKKHLTNQYIDDVKYHINNQTQRRIPDSFRGYVPMRTTDDNPLLQLITQTASCKMQYDQLYLPQIKISKDKIYDVLLEQDMNPNWVLRYKCKMCNLNKYKVQTHKILQCNTTKSARHNIYKSLESELNYILKIEEVNEKDEDIIVKLVTECKNILINNDNITIPQ